MNLLYVTRVQIPSFVAQSSQIDAMSRAFNLSVNNFRLISPWSPNNDKVLKSYPWIKVNVPEYFKHFFFLFKMFFLLLFYDRTYIVYTRDIGISLICTILFRRSCFEAHKEPKGKLAPFIFSLLIRTPHFSVICISSALRDYYVSRYNIKSHNIDFYHDCAFVDDYDSIRINSKEELRKELNLPVDKFIILHSGSLYDGRGIELIEPILSSGIDLLFVQVGGLTEDINRWKQYYSKYNNIVFFPHQNKDILMKFQISADLLFYPITKRTNTWWCCSPMKIFEYMASGTPILCANIGSIAEVLSENNSYPYCPENPLSIITSLKNAINNYSAAVSKSNIALSQVRSKYNWYYRADYIKNFLKKYIEY